MSERHTMTRTGGNPAESLFSCSVAGCDRRLVINHADGRIFVLNRGAGALHQGFAGPISFVGDLETEGPPGN